MSEALEKAGGGGGSTAPAPPPLARVATIPQMFTSKISSEQKQEIDVLTLKVFVYHKHVVPYNYFVNPTMRALLDAAVRTGRAGYQPVNEKMMQRWVAAEHDRQLSWFRGEYAACAQLSGGGHLQLFHDGGTPKDGKSYNVVGVQQVSLDWSRNDCWCLSARPTPTKSDQDVAEDIKAALETATGLPMANCVGEVIADGAAQGAADLLGFRGASASSTSLSASPSRPSETSSAAATKSRSTPSQPSSRC